MEKISVSIRVRPLSKQEAKGSPWKLEHNSIALCNASGYPISGQSYTFDRVFGRESTTLDIYEAHTKDIIASTVKGFNGTVLAYGQTSSGKTFTMRGTLQEPGIIPLAVQEVFRNIHMKIVNFLLRVSYLEIYNEEINDLLAPDNQKLQVHENLERGIFVAGLREEIVVTPEQVLELTEFGESHRHVGETNMNVYSSRSHTIFRMVIESRDRSQDDPSGPATMQECDAVRVSVLNLVDLAGSERVAKSGAEGTRLKEGTHINKSLMTLGTVINKLSEGIEKQGGHIPYRDSKLTRILQPALGGNAKTAIICNITPALVHVDETRGTLYFASRANCVTNCAQVNEIMTDAALLKRQKREIEELRSKLKGSHSEHWEEEILNLRNALLKTELERERMALELQEEKKAQAERERRLKEQAQRIQNLSTMVINSAVDDRDFEKRNKKGNRRETWCPRIPLLELDIEQQDLKRSFTKATARGPLHELALPSRRERMQGLPPPFEKLCEEEDTTAFEGFKVAEGNSAAGSPSESGSFGLGSFYLDPSSRIHVAKRKRRSTEETMPTELKQQLSDLQENYEDLQYEHELKMREKMIEMEELKNELAYAQAAVSKSRKLDDNYQNCQEVGKKGKSLDLWGTEPCAGSIKHLRTQVHNLELEKTYMQRELDSLMEQAQDQSSTAKENLEKANQELCNARKDAREVELQLAVALQHIQQLEKEKKAELELQTQLAIALGELKSEVEATKSTTDGFNAVAIESSQALDLHARNFQVLKQTLQRDVEEKASLVQHGEAMQVAIQVLEGERDALMETTKQAQADMDRLQGKRRQELKEAQTKLELALSENQIAAERLGALHSLLSQKDEEQQALQQKIQNLEAGSARDLGGAASALCMVNQEKETAILKLREATDELELQSTQLTNLKQEHAALAEKFHDCKDAWKATEASAKELEGQKEVLVHQLTESHLEMEELKAAIAAHAEDHSLECSSVVQEISFLREQQQHKIEKLQACDAALQSAEASAIEAAKEKEELAQKLIAVEAEMEDAKAGWARLADRCSANLEALSLEKDALVEERNELKAALDLVEKERDSLKELSDQSQEKLKVLETKVELQRQEIKSVGTVLGIENSEKAEAGELLRELQALLSQRVGEVQSLQKKIVDAEAGAAVAKEALEKRVSELDMKLELLSAGSANAREHMMNVEKDRDTLLKELEKKLYTANTEIAETGKQLKEAHSCLSANFQEQQILQEKLTELNAEKSKMERSLGEREGQLATLREASAEAINKLEMTTMALRKDLVAAKAAPAALEKERDSIRKELEKLKAKMKDTEAKVKSILQEKSKIEAEKANMERELKQLRQSTVLLNKRESIVDKRRESIATGLNKTKMQLSSTEHQLQMRTAELERTVFDLQLLQDSFAKLEFAMSETESASTTLKEKHAEAESTIAVLSQEKASLTCSMVKISDELEAALEQQRTTSSQLEALQEEHTSLVQMLQSCEASCKAAELLANQIARERDNFAQQLTDAQFELEEEKAACATQTDDHDAKCHKLCKEIANLTHQVQQLQKVQEEAVTARDALEGQVCQLEQALQDRKEQSLLHEEQVEHLTAKLEEKVTLAKEHSTMLEEQVALEKENSKKLQEQIELAATSIREEMEARMKLLDESQQLEQRLQESEVKLAGGPTAEHMLALDTKLRELEDHAFKLEAECSTERESACLARNEVQILQAQLNKARRQGEDIQSDLNKAGLETNALRSQIAVLDACKEQLLEQLQHSSKECVKLQNNLAVVFKENWISSGKLQVRLEKTKNKMLAFQGRWRDSKMVIQELTESLRKVETTLEETRKSQAHESLKAELTGAKLEIVQLHVELESLRDQCQRYESELKEAKNKELTYQEDLQRENHLVEMMHQNYTLQLRVKAEENAEALKDELSKVSKAKEASTLELEAALGKLKAQKVKLEKELTALRGELHSAQKLGTFGMSIGGLKTTATCGRERQTADAQLQQGNTPSANKTFGQLKLQRSREPGWITNQVGANMDPSDSMEEPPPPSSTLHSRDERLSAPIWIKRHVGGASVESNLPPPAFTPLSGQNPQKSSFAPMSHQRVALLPLSHKNTAGTLVGRDEKMSITLRSQSKLLMPTSTDTSSSRLSDRDNKAALAGVLTSRNFKATEADKENL